MIKTIFKIQHNFFSGNSFEEEINWNDDDLWWKVVTGVLHEIRNIPFIFIQRML